MKKTFTLLELIFVLVIVSILSYFVVSNSFTGIQKANITQIKSEIALVRMAINKNFTDSVMLNNLARYISYLDDAPIEEKNKTLFGGINDDILLDPIIFSTSTSNKKIGAWIKTNQREYKIYLNNQNYVLFTYDNEKGLFDCDNKDDLCKELTQ